MTTEHKGIEPVAFLYTDNEGRRLLVEKRKTVHAYDSETPLYPQSAIDTLQAEKAALEKQRDALVKGYEIIKMVKREIPWTVGDFDVELLYKDICEAMTHFDAAIANAKGAAA